MAGQWSALGVLLGSAIALSGARADEGDSVPPAEQPNLVKQANAPISNILQIRMLDSYVPKFTGVDGQGNVLTMSMTMPLPAYRLLPIPQLSLLSVPTAITPPGGSTGFGDVRLLNIGVLRARDGIVWGVGPTAVFPTASQRATGEGKWQLGPAAAVAFTPGRWLIGVLAQNPLSFAGDGDREETNALFLQPFVTYQLGRGWFVRTQPQMVFDWKTDRQVLPLDLGVGRLFQLGGQNVSCVVEPFWNASGDEPALVYGVTFGISLLYPDFSADYSAEGPMKTTRVIKIAGHLAKPYRVTEGRKFRLKDVDPGDTGTLKSEDKARAKEALRIGVEALTELQDMLYAQDRWAVLLIFQAMDAAGKDGAIKHVMSGINPQGCEVYSFKAPGSNELDHDYLWRTHTRVPERGRIGIFNRSYYEEVLVVRVHPELLEFQKLPAKSFGKDIWQNRYKDIQNFERYLTRNGVTICKFFLHVSRDEQKRRFLERLEKPEKNWKFSPTDVRERAFWKAYMKAYEDAIRATASKHAPWYVVPADNKWYTRVIVAAAIIDTLSSLGLEYPKVDTAKKKELAAARRALLRAG